MSTHADDRHATADRRSADADLAVFAGIMMVVAGLYHALTGIAALFRDQVHVETPGYTYELDLTGWGWTHLLLGALVLATGVAVLRGTSWGPVVGIVLVSLSLLANFLFLPTHPVWSLLIIGLDVTVILGLTAGRRSPRSTPRG
jgi:hypothetical protein